MTIVEIEHGHVTARIGLEGWKVFERRMGLDISAISEFPPDIVYQKKLSMTRSVAIHLGLALRSLEDEFFAVKSTGSVDGDDVVVDIIAKKKGA